MKIIYIATATNERGDTIQENAYMDAEQALAQAKKMCDDIHRNTNMQVVPDAMPIELFEVGDVVPEPAIGTD
jgi:hypothetical protein